MFSVCVGHLAAEGRGRAGRAMWAPRAGALQAVPARIPLSLAFPGTLSTFETGPSALVSRPALCTMFSSGVFPLSLEATRKRRHHQDSKASWSSPASRPEDGHFRRPLVATGILGSMKHGIREISAKPFLFFFLKFILLLFSYSCLHFSVFVI